MSGELAILATSPPTSRSNRALSVRCREANDSNGLMLFMKFDRDKDGLLTKSEFIEGLESLGDLIDLSSHEAGRLFDKLDESGIGTVDMKEFQKVFSDPRKIYLYTEFLRR